MEQQREVLLAEACVFLGYQLTLVLVLTDRVLVSGKVVGGRAAAETLRSQGRFNVADSAFAAFLVGYDQGVKLTARAVPLSAASIFSAIDGMSMRINDPACCAGMTQAECYAEAWSNDTFTSAREESGGQAQQVWPLVQISCVMLYYVLAS